ncbi:hypothetical protein [Vibrio harveyi]|uniref:hypothetical protein n=1 Tax=Vibrio harveyi TaxID=669 RepID=UPI0012630B97|nr:hypothetical protein [Vibrio harveyi]QFQ77041.1 hypothetical protein F9277_06135 [Vibrio harveyi]
MRIDVYKSNKNNSKFLSVEAGKDVAELGLPSDIDRDMLDLSLFKQNLELDPSIPRIALDDATVAKQICENGYAIHFAKVESEILI